MKIIWLNYILYQLNLFSILNGKLAPVHNRSGYSVLVSLAFSFVSVASPNDAPATRGKRFSNAFDCLRPQLLPMHWFFHKTDWKILSFGPGLDSTSLECSSKVPSSLQWKWSFNTGNCDKMHNIASIKMISWYL